MYERIIMNLVETLQRIYNLKKCNIHTLTYEYNIKAKRYSVCAGIMTIAEAQTPLGLIELLTITIDYELSTIKQEQ